MSDGWIQAIDEALVTAHIGTAETSDSYETAKRKLGELIDWHVAVATDYRVNGGWQMVPVEPTDEMLGEIHLIREFTVQAIRARYAAMLDAAPTPGGGDEQ